MIRFFSPWLIDRFDNICNLLYLEAPTTNKIVLNVFMV